MENKFQNDPKMKLCRQYLQKVHWRKVVPFNHIVKDESKMEIWNFIIWCFISCLVYRIAIGFYKFIYGSVFLKFRLNSYGEWAVITGCTGGLGLEFSRQIAQLGINVVLVDKCDETTLENLSTELEQKYNVITKRIVCDFRDSSEENYERLFDLIDTLDVGILINNAGVLYDCPSLYHKLTHRKLRDLVDINIFPPMMLAHHFINTKILQKKKGLLVFIGSYSGVIPQPFIAGYSATKGFISFLTKALALEYKEHGIFIQGLCPFFIATPMNNYSKFLTTPSFICPSPKVYVRKALPTFGMTNFTTGYYPFEIAAYAFSMGPEWLTLGVSKLVLHLIMSRSKVRN